MHHRKPCCGPYAQFNRAIVRDLTHVMQSARRIEPAVGKLAVNHPTSYSLIEKYASE
ncbi:MAG: hypothetical protein ACI8W7_003671 [Gammaproteobacteria bacterium]|jgi:hypothetical protein